LTSLTHRPCLNSIQCSVLVGHSAGPHHVSRWSSS